MGSLFNFSLLALAMLAFAGNSLLCRVALKGGAIDAASFTSVRLREKGPGTNYPIFLS